MPHKHKKSNVLKNDVLGVEKKENPPETPAILPATNYKEIRENEADALRSIYSTDFEDVEVRQAAWHVSFVQQALVFLYLYGYAYIYGTVCSWSGK